MSTRRTVTFAVAVLWVLSLMFTGAVPTASAAGNPDKHDPRTVSVGRNGHVHFFPNVKSQAKFRTTIPGACPVTCHNLLPYGADGGGGGPVMNTSHIYTIYWLPNGYHFEGNNDGMGPNAGDTSYQTILNKFAGHLGGTGYYNTLTQYPSHAGALTNSSSYGGTWFDTTAYPCGTNCGSHTSPNFLSDADIQNEVLSAVSANSWPSGRSNLYLVYYGFGVQSCASFGCTNTNFCAYHGNFSSGGNEYLYGNEFDNGPGTNCHITGQGTPNGDAYADYTANVTSHEVSEAITDPEPNNAWTDFGNNNQYGQSGEIGDMCAWVQSKMGTITLSDSSQFYVQGEWDNNAGDCSLSSSINTSVVYTGPTTASPGQTFTASATFMDNNTLGVGEQSVTFSLGSSTCSGTTDFAVPGTSTGSASCTLTAPSSPGSYTLHVGYVGGIGAYQASSTSASFGVNQIPTTLTYTGPTSGDYNDPVTLSAYLKDSSNTPISGKLITIGFGAESCGGKTDSSGNASCSVTPLDNVSGSPYTITATFAGDSAYVKSSDASQSFTLNQEDTKLSYTGATMSDYNDLVTLKSQLTDPTDNSGIANQSVQMSFGVESCNGTTDAGGVASCSVTPADLAGPYTLTASFTDPKGNFAFASTSSPFTVNLEDTTLNAGSLPQFIATGSMVTLSSTLSDTTDGLPIAGKTIQMQLGATGPACSGTTNASGIASCTVTVPASLQGPQTATYGFTSDGYNASASTTKPTLVFTYLAKGTFDLGDKSVMTATSTTTLTWWADTWASLNSLSGGAAPSAFKGFAPNLFSSQGMPTGQLTCGDSFNYNTTGGNSSVPPTTVPQYMAVAVSSKVTKSGNVVNGNVPKVVIVHVGPGYAPNPVNHGTGQVVGTLCG